MIKYIFMLGVFFSTQTFSSTAFISKKNKTNSTASQRVYSDSVQRQMASPPLPGQRVYSNSGSTITPEMPEVKYTTIPGNATIPASTLQPSKPPTTNSSSNAQAPAQQPTGSFVAGPCVTVGPGAGCAPPPLTYSWEIKFCAMHGCTPYSAGNIFDIERSCSASNAGQVIRFVQTAANGATQDHVAVCFASTSTDFLTQIAQPPSETVYVGPKKEYYFVAPPITQAEREQYGIIITTGPGGTCTAQNLGATQFVPRGGGNTLDRNYTCVMKGSAEETQILSGSGSQSNPVTAPASIPAVQCAAGEFTNDTGQIVSWKCHCGGDNSGWADQGNQCFHKLK